MDSNTMTMRVIPKKVKPVINVETGEAIKKRVCAYARVSTDLDDQKNSLAAQKEEYSKRIAEHPDWEYAGLFYDEGISGTSVKNRKGFTDMLNACRAGKIDLILVKSISRFARNTVDCIQTVRELRSLDVEVFFEKEYLYASDKKANMMLTFFAQFAQEESASISENVKWGVRARMRAGKRKMNTATTVGYVTDPEGKVVIDLSEVETIREIFNLYLSGYSYRYIASFFNKKGVLNGSGNLWKPADIMRTLSNEKYIGTFVMQKTVVKDFLDHKAYINDGIEEKFVLENHHESIIDREIFEIIQAIRKNKTLSVCCGDNTILLMYKRMVCENCLRPLSIIKCHPQTSFERMTFTCKTTLKSSINYVKCDINGTLDYNSVCKAIELIFERFKLVKEGVISLLKTTYKNALTSLGKEIIKLKDENINLQSKLSEVITKQIQEGNIERGKFEYEQITKKIAYNNKRIKEIGKDAISNLQTQKAFDDMDKYFTDKCLTYNIVSMFIKKAIRRKDNSVRFILADNDLEIKQNNIKYYLSLTPQYEDKVSTGRFDLNFDVIDLRGEHHD